ncbi:MAG: hypothetical protein UX09_C0032G0002 [Candidatus Uhrbacteria bacterium GW2011_GWE2_45_35]|uniref:Glutaredoxin domain-containing protein n=2 Tax=Candidatus Uhriibacteriota TaxID=1752732 RepID=A0A0G1LNQ2_9BACT|nr:MAG: hypothetical protein UW63_C0026G0002 [Candidatus Uhrbacteria bacterium GW2011_GWF2_44_350]KKU07269.1 MAG: hypothetical protein UX09_C0032G0002 [Candidatus Uhrbacteria bacterium GW2011_GWE2_45_35]
MYNKIKLAHFQKNLLNIGTSMKKDLLFPIIISATILIIVGLFVVLLKLTHPTPIESGLTFFYSDSCPHCTNVEAFFAENNVEEKITFNKIEINSSVENTQFFYDVNLACGITKTEEMGVPLLWDGISCVNGDEPIITYFENQLAL